MAIAGTLVTRFGNDGIRSGGTIDEVVDIARYAATHGTAWETAGCTALVWAITNLAGVPLNNASNGNRTVNNNPLTPIRANDSPYYVSADNSGDGWEKTNLSSDSNKFAKIAAGDILRIEAYNASAVKGVHSMIVTRVNGTDPSDIWVVDNYNSKVIEHRLSDVVADMNSYGGIKTFLRHRLNETYVADNIPQAVEGWGKGQFHNIAPDLPGNATTTEVLSIGSSLNNAIDFAGDSDWFKVWLISGNSYSFAVRGTGTGNGTLADPKIRIRTPDGTHLSQWDNDNSPQTDDGGDARISGYTATETGYHYVTAYANGSGVGTYRISAVSSGTSTGGVQSGDRDISSSFQDAQAIQVDAIPFQTALDSVGDVDYFAVQLIAGNEYKLTATAMYSGGAVDGLLTLYDPSQSVVGTDDDSGGNYDPLLLFTPTTSGTHYFTVQDYGTNIGTYSVRVELLRDNSLPVPTTGDDRLTGTNDADVIDALAGNDVISGLAGSDRIRGNSGNDTIYGHSGNDWLSGDNGNDVISGHLGRDFIFGGHGADRLWGQDGHDRIHGGTGRDRLSGGTGNDWLYGDGGIDTLIGGAGEDKFVFNVDPTFGNSDRIVDFNSAADRIYLSSRNYDALSKGALSQTAFAANTSGSAQDASDRIIYETDTGRLFYDADGRGGATRQLVAILSGAPEVEAADFWIY